MNEIHKSKIIVKQRPLRFTFFLASLVHAENFFHFFRATMSICGREIKIYQIESFNVTMTGWLGTVSTVGYLKSLWLHQ